MNRQKVIEEFFSLSEEEILALSSEKLRWYVEKMKAPQTNTFEKSYEKYYKLSFEEAVRSISGEFEMAINRQIIDLYFVILIVYNREPV